MIDRVVIVDEKRLVMILLLLFFIWNFDIFLIRVINIYVIFIVMLLILLLFNGEWIVNNSINGDEKWFIFFVIIEEI